MKFANKITILLLSIVLISIIFISSFVYISNINTLQNEISERLKEDAFHIMDKIDRSFFERYSDVQIIAQDLIINSRDSTPQEKTLRLLQFRNTYKVYSSLSFFDLERVRIADTAGLHLGEKHSLTPYWEDVLEGKISAASDIREAEELKVPIIYFASPVKDKNGETFGVVVARMPSSKLYDIVRTVELVEETNFEIDLIDKEGLLLYSNHDPTGILEDKLSSHLQMINIQKFTPVGVMDHFTTVNKEKALMAFSRQQGHLDFKGNDWILLIHLPLEIAFTPAIKLRNRVLSITLLLGIIIILTSLYFSRKFTKPIAELSRAAEELKKGNFKVRVDIKSKDELQELGETFNKTIIALSQTKSERKGIESAKTRFLSITSHELRSPMTPLKAQLQMLEGEYFGKLNEKQKEAISIVVRNADHLDRIIVDFLEISRIEAARLKFLFEKVSLNKSVNDLLTVMKSYAIL
jgi:HAMP domain-containing protein